MNQLPHLDHPARDGAAPSPRLGTVGLAVHPRRRIDEALAAVRGWAEAHGAELVQVDVLAHERQVADAGDIGACDLVLAIGGDGTALAALHAAARVGRPVLGVACGSLGALTETGADELRDALERVSAGDWQARPLPGLRVVDDDGDTRAAINDVVVVRGGASQVTIEVRVDGALYARYAGDGVAVATPLGSSAYSMAAGGPILAPGADALAVTPLAPHGGCCPPLVVGSSSEVAVTVEPGYHGARLELDGQPAEDQPALLRITRVDRYATLVALGHEEPMLAGLRRRRIIIDSPRVLARDDRAAAGR